MLDGVFCDHLLLVRWDHIDADPARLSDTRREDEAVNSSHGSCQRTDLAHHAEYEQFYGFASAQIVAGKQGTHVA